MDDPASSVSLKVRPQFLTKTVNEQQLQIHEITTHNRHQRVFEQLDLMDTVFCHYGVDELELYVFIAAHYP